MNDLISRQAAIELIHSLYPSAPIMRMNRKRWEKKYKPYIESEKALERLPSAQPPYNLDEWCHDCKEYDQERHCCPRFNRVIKQTKEDFEAQNEIIHCTDCRYHGMAICRIWSRYGTINTPGYGFCYWAERKEQDETD